MAAYDRAGMEVLSCTTDGFLVKTNEGFTKESVVKGPFGSTIQTALSNLGITAFFLEEKHYDQEGVYT